MKKYVYFAAAAVVSLGLAFGSAFAASTKSLVDNVSKSAGISADQAQAQVDQVFSALKAEMEAGREVGVKNFGRFYLQERKARLGRNPRTGEQLQIPARRYARFSVSDNFKNHLNENAPVTKVASAKPAEAAVTAQAKTAPKAVN